MSIIHVNPLAAQEQVTKLSNAADELRTDVEITFSDSTTISGNEKAKESARKIKNYTEILSQALLRDVENIQSLAASFVRVDTAISQTLDFSESGRK